MIDFLFYIIPVIWLGTQHHRRWGSLLDPEHWISASGIALAMYIFYIIIIFLAGPDTLSSHYSSSSGPRTTRGSMTAFMLPGTGLAIAMFPKAASEQIFDILAVARAGVISELAKVLGWVLVAYWLLCSVFYMGR